MSFNCGIVGLPNVGKSTIFNCLTKKRNADAQNYAFCTIEPNEAMVTIPDPRLQAISDIVNPKEIIPTTVEFVDIAGLVKDASSGAGLGNKFLENIRNTKIIVHVVRCFEDDDIMHVDDKVCPKSDIETIDTELILSDLDLVDKAIKKREKIAKGGDKEAKAQLIILKSLKDYLGEGNSARGYPEIDEVSFIPLLSAKPVLFVANVSEDGFANNHHLDSVIEIANEQDAKVIPICASIEEELIDLCEEEKKEFLNELGVSESGLDKVIRAGYELLDLETYFTAGEKEVRAWTVKKASTAPMAAGKIHTDFEKGFIRAEVISYADYIEYKGESGAKEAGKWRLEGKDYIVQDGDVIHFRFNV